MKVLGISGSRRKHGNTYTLVQEALIPFKEKNIETDLISLGDYSIKGCNGCEGCRDSYRCVVQDDMQKIYPKLLESDALILGSPTYFYNVTSDMKAFIDRCYCFEVFDQDDRSVWMGLNEILGGKYAVVIAVCEQNREEDMGFTVPSMIKPLEALGYRVTGTVKTLHLFSAGEALKDEQAKKEAREAGEKLLKTLQLREKIKDRYSQNNP